MIFIDACYRRPTPRPPIWIMRQAGRYLPEYRAIRSKSNFLEMCENPEVVKEVTLQPIRRFGMDAAIIFSDILIPLRPMGLKLRFAAGEGPVIDNPITCMDDVKALRKPDFPADVSFLTEALRLTRAELDPEKALLGFAGAPFTLACYAIQGCGGKNFEVVRQFMYRDPQAFDALLDFFADITIEYLRVQVEAGANAVQIFDSWGGLISGYDYVHRIFPHVQKVLRGLADLKVPRILFIKGAGHFRTFINQADAEVIGLDWTMPIEDSRNILGDQFAIQGNMDPMVLFASEEFIRSRTLAMIEVNKDRPGYIVNLGHGINKETPVENVAVFVDTVKNYKAKEWK